MGNAKHSCDEADCERTDISPLYDNTMSVVISWDRNGPHEVKHIRGWYCNDHNPFISVE